MNIPTLVLVAQRDDPTPWDVAIDAFREVQSPEEKLFINPKTSHMALCANRSKLEIAAEVARDWLVDHLVKPYE